ncbi:MAG: sugar phosphate isomerase/epimerase [Planctomycetota bacterium]
MRLAWSTLACPDWTLDAVAAFTSRSGFDAAELRTFGPGDGQLACEPFLTGPSKLAEVFASEGAAVAGLATSARFDDPIWPPIVGRVFTDLERGVRETQRAIDLADDIGAGYVRVFGFEVPAHETRRRAIKRLGDLIARAVDRADKRGVRVVVENGGDFREAEALEALLDRADHPLVRACYHAAVGAQAGDNIASAMRRLGSKLDIVRLTDTRGDRPCALGEGESSARETVEAAQAVGFDGTLVYEYPAMWFEARGDVEPVLSSAAETIYGWLAPASSAAAPEAAAV